MKTKLVLALGCVALLASFTSVAMADAITFTFTDKVAVNVSNPGGQFFTTDKNDQVVVSDTKPLPSLTLPVGANVILATSGSATGTISPLFASEFFPGGSAIEVQVDSPACVGGAMPGVCVQGTWNLGTFTAVKGDGGSWGGIYDVTYVSPFITSYFGDPNAWVGNGGSSFTTTGDKWGGSAFPISATLGSGQIALQTVPEPGTLALLGTGILGLAGFIRRKRQ
jgi:PEP-CTERM motif-containing protein